MEFEVASLTNKLNAILAELQSKAPCPIVAESDISPQPSYISLQPSAFSHLPSLPCPFGIAVVFNCLAHIEKRLIQRFAFGEDFYVLSPWNHTEMLWHFQFVNGVDEFQLVLPNALFLVAPPKVQRFVDYYPLAIRQRVIDELQHADNKSYTSVSCTSNW